MLKSPLGDIIWKSHQVHGAIFGGKVTLSWAERLKRVFDIDISVCPLCGATLS